MAKTRFHTLESFEKQVREESQERHLVLGLDLGTKCGYCYSYLQTIDDTFNNELIPAEDNIFPWQMGQWDLSAGSYDSGAIRFVRLRHFLQALQPALVFYEDVKFTPSETITRYSAARVIARAATASELIGAFRATTATWCEEQGIGCAGFSIGEIKKRATGKGNSNKKAMIKACNETFGTDFDDDDYESTGVDNIADAAFVCLLGVEQYGKGVEGTA